MKIVRYIDIVQPVVDEEGNVYEKTVLSNFTIPTIIDPNGVELISPLFSGKGKLFKNVSIIKYQNELIKVVGNYKTLSDRVNGHSLTPIGFKNEQKQTAVENRTKIKSNSQRGTKGSSK